MNAARGLLGQYVPGRTPWHRLPVGAKYAVFVVLSVAALVAPGPVGVLVVLGLAAVLVATTRAPLRMAWGLPAGLVLLLGILFGYHLLAGSAPTGIRVVATILVALFGSRLLLLTTPLPVLVDALVAFVGPLRHLGVNPERVGLAVAVLVRSIPSVAGSFSEVRDAARARGLSRHPLAALTPVVIQAVAYARATGDALVARGLGDDDP